QQVVVVGLVRLERGQRGALGERVATCEQLGGVAVVDALELHQLAPLEGAAVLDDPRFGGLIEDALLVSEQQLHPLDEHVFGRIGEGPDEQLAPRPVRPYKAADDQVLRQGATRARRQAQASASAPPAAPRGVPGSNVSAASATVVCGSTVSPAAGSTLASAAGAACLRPFFGAACGSCTSTCGPSCSPASGQTAALA